MTLEFKGVSASDVPAALGELRTAALAKSQQLSQQIKAGQTRSQAFRAQLLGQFTKAELEGRSTGLHARPRRIGGGPGARRLQATEAAGEEHARAKVETDAIALPQQARVAGSAPVSVESHAELVHHRRGAEPVVARGGAAAGRSAFASLTGFVGAPGDSQGRGGQQGRGGDGFGTVTGRPWMSALSGRLGVAFFQMFRAAKTGGLGWTSLRSRVPAAQDAAGLSDRSAKQLRAADIQVAAID